MERFEEATPVGELGGNPGGGAGTDGDIPATDRKPRCQATVYKRDTYRYTGRGPGGFQMHYTECQCERRATHGEFCYQHADTKEWSKCRFASRFMDERPHRKPTISRLP